jgi:signal peptidase II
MSRIPTSRYLLFAALAALGCLSDLATKNWAFSRLGFPTREPIWLVPEVLSLETSLNEGALFGVGQGLTLVFALLSMVAAAGILYWLFYAGAARDLLLTIALGSITAGVFGNLYDRLGMPRLEWPFPTQKHAAGDPVYAVRDWIHFQYKSFDWPIFNLADSFLVCGAGLLVWHSCRQGAAQPVARAVQEPAG